MSAPPILKTTSRKLTRQYRRAYVWQARLRGRTIVHVLHIGKTGGNAIRHALGLRKERPTRANGCLLIQRAHDVTLEMCPPGDRVVVMVRHPIPRFVSGFWSRYRRGRQDPGALNADEAAAFERFTSPEALALALSDGDPEVRGAAERAMAAIVHVRDTLTFYLKSPEYLRARRDDLLHIGFQERLNWDLAVITGRLGLTPSAELPVDDRQAHRTPDSFSRDLSNTARANLETWYAADLSIYATCRRMAGLDE